MRVVDADGAVLFEEKLEYSEWLCSTVAPKVGKFSYEEIVELKNLWAEKLCLRSHELWREHLLSSMADFAYTRGTDTWLYGEVLTRADKILALTHSLGCELHILRRESIHAVSGIKWTTILIADRKHENVLGICGYHWED